MDVPTSQHEHLKDRAASNGRRWDEPNKVVMMIGAILIATGGWFGSMVWAMSHNAELKNVEQDTILMMLVKSQQEFSGKLDRILERIPK